MITDARQAIGACLPSAASMMGERANAITEGIIAGLQLVLDDLQAVLAEQDLDTCTELMLDSVLGVYGVPRRGLTVAEKRRIAKACRLTQAAALGPGGLDKVAERTDGLFGIWTMMTGLSSANASISVYGYGVASEPDPVTGIHPPPMSELRGTIQSDYDNSVRAELLDAYAAVLRLARRAGFHISAMIRWPIASGKQTLALDAGHDWAANGDSAYTWVHTVI